MYNSYIDAFLSITIISLFYVGMNLINKWAAIQLDRINHSMDNIYLNITSENQDESYDLLQKESIKLQRIGTISAVLHVAIFLVACVFIILV